MTASEIPRDVRQGVLTRDGFSCWLCGVNVGRGVYSLHHRQGRAGGRDPHRYSNLLTLCGTGTTGCHDWVHAHPREARQSGWLISKFSRQWPDCLRP